MKVSIVVLTKNPGSIFRTVLSAIKFQKTNFNFEIIIVDSGSTDGTVEFCKMDNSVKLVQIKSNEFGHGKTRNLAVSIAKGEFVALLTHDACPKNENWLSELVKIVEVDKNIAGVFGRHEAYPSASPYTKRDIKAHFDGFLRHSVIQKLDNMERYETDLGYKQMLHFFSDNNACIRKSVWEKMPYPDVEFAEDQIWAKAIIESGYSKAFASNAIVYHSHDFGIIEQMKRSFDESYAFKKYFGYKVGPNLLNLAKQSVGTTLVDWRYTFLRKQLSKDVKWFLSSPIRNFSRQVGYYLGQRAEYLPDFLVLFLSRDRTIQKG